MSDSLKNLLSKKVSDLTVEEVLLLLGQISECIQSSILAHNTDEIRDKKIEHRDKTQADQKSHTVISLTSFIKDTDKTYSHKHADLVPQIMDTLWYHRTKRYDTERALAGLFECPETSEPMVDLREFANFCKDPSLYRRLGHLFEDDRWTLSCQAFLEHMLKKRGFKI